MGVVRQAGVDEVDESLGNLICPKAKLKAESSQLERQRERGLGHSQK